MKFGKTLESVQATVQGTNMLTGSTLSCLRTKSTNTSTAVGSTVEISTALIRICTIYSPNSFSAVMWNLKAYRLRSLRSILDGSVLSKIIIKTPATLLTVITAVYLIWVSLHCIFSAISLGLWTPIATDYFERRRTKRAVQFVHLIII